jgi:hypothetical protein
MATLLALAASVVWRDGGCTAAESGPPNGVPQFASGATGVMVTCGGGPELVSVVRMVVLATAVVAWLLLAVVFVQTVLGRRFLPLPVRAPVWPGLFALGVAIEAVAVGLVALEVLVPPIPSAGLLVVSNPLFIVGAMVMWYGRHGNARRGGRDGLST